MEKINLAELLKDCPKGMELDCTICNGVKFVELDRNPNFPIVVRANNGYEFTLTKYGQVHNINDAKCVIFPKGKTTWEGFVPPFKDGDILVTDLGSIFILKEPNEKEYHYSCYIALNDASQIIKSYTQFCTKKGCRLATEEEKQKLFQAIKDNGYKWNEEIKTLEELIQPKFKIGDRIVHKVNKESPFIITEITNDCYKGGTQYEVLIEQQNNFELVPYKFDINTLKPFESRVLVRNSENQYWIPAFWGFKAKDGYVTTFGHCNYCVPYEGNEHLLETTDDCDNFYKTWE